MTVPQIEDPVEVEVVDLVGDIKLKPGYNCTISVIEENNEVVIGADESAGEGEPCSDVRIGESSSSSSEICEGCRGFVYGMNGLGRGDAQLLISSSGGVIVEKTGAHSLRVTVDAEKICVVT